MGGRATLEVHLNLGVIYGKKRRCSELGRQIHNKARLGAWDTPGVSVQFWCCIQDSGQFVLQQHIPKFMCESSRGVKCWGVSVAPNFIRVSV